MKGEKEGLILAQSYQEELRKLQKRRSRKAKKKIIKKKRKGAK